MMCLETEKMVGSAQELVSRDDPLYEILQSTVYDAVLERAELILGLGRVHGVIMGFIYGIYDIYIYIHIYI